MFKPSAGLHIAAALLLGLGAGCSVTDLAADSDVTSRRSGPLPTVTVVTDFFVHKDLYTLNTHLDRDGDGIACEKL